MTLAACLAIPAAAAADSTPAWPPLLLARDRYPPAVAALVEQTWGRATFSRSVKGRPLPVPMRLYAALVDTPEVTAAARFRGFARDEVRRVNEDWYEAEDHRGARGYYRVLARDPVHRVLLSRGEHRSRWLGTVKGSALTILTLEEQGGAVDPRLTAYVRIENPVAAALTRLLVVPFGALVDRRLTEGVEIAGRVAEWGVRDPDGFCGWLMATAPARRNRIVDTLPACASRAVRPADARGAGLVEGGHAR